MEFTLIYDGPIRPSQRPKKKDDTSRLSEHKMEIRKELSKQIKTIWERHPALQKANVCTSCKFKHGFMDVQQQSHNLIPLKDYFLNNDPHVIKFEDGKTQTCIAIANDHLHLNCEVDFFILSAEGKSAAHVIGDVDNRVKTLIDCLCWPNGNERLPKDYQTQLPLYTAVSDDRLITGISVKTDLDPRPVQGSISASAQNLAVITVRLTPIFATPTNSVFL